MSKLYGLVGRKSWCQNHSLLLHRCSADAHIMRARKHANAVEITDLAGIMVWCRSYRACRDSRYRARVGLIRRLPVHPQSVAPEPTGSWRSL